MPTLVTLIQNSFYVEFLSILLSDYDDEISCDVISATFWKLGKSALEWSYERSKIVEKFK